MLYNYWVFSNKGHPFLIVFYRFIGLVWDVLIFQARALAVQAVVVTLAVSAAPEVQTVRDVRACYV